MKILNFLKYFFIFLLFISIFIFYFCDHASKETYAKEIYAGGEIIYYDLCIPSNKSINAVFPLISANKVNNIKLKKTTNKDANSNIKCSIKFKATNTKYKDCFVNYFTVIFKQTSKSSVKLSLDIDGFDLTIDKNDFVYKTPHFKLCNSSAILKSDETLAPVNEISKIDKRESYNYIPTKDKLANAYYNLSNNLYLIRMQSADFYDIDDCYINGDSYDPKNIYCNMHNHNYMTLQYSIKYKNNMYKRFFTRSYFTITYEKNCQIKKYISNSELSITPLHDADQITSSYIQNEYIR